jgi:7,8-dihydropterin-6-yl-methyl-4-(beta-D-ribofuranosyl)aminobenzene 5'-phosphate synthase
MPRMIARTLAASFFVSGLAAASVSAQTPRASQVKLTVLSTMLVGNANAGIGEWGFAAAPGSGRPPTPHDTGARAETVLKNAIELKVDLASITDLVIPHNHTDHHLLSSAWS